MPLVASLDEAASRPTCQIVVDLRTSRCSGRASGLALASRVLAHGLLYAGADFRFDAPAFTLFALPSLAFGGTGKRVGKTAVTAHAARLLARPGRSWPWRWGAAGRPSPSS